MLNLTIDPMKIEDKKSEDLLIHLLEIEKDRLLIPKSRAFKIEFELESYCIDLTKTLVRASSNEEGLNVYHIISSDLLGSGKHAKIFSVESDMLVSFEKKTLVHIKPNQPLVLKYKAETICMHSTAQVNFEIQAFQKLCTHEYEQSKHGHLALEEPHFRYSHHLDQYTGEKKLHMEAFLLMNKMPGIELFDVLLHLLDVKSQVTSYVRFLLTFNLLHTFYNQVVKHKQVHGDLKPENIMLEIPGQEDYKSFVLDGGLSNNLAVPQFKMNIIDYEASYFWGATRNRLVCTPDYAAAEIFKHQDATCAPYPAVLDEKIDLVSVAIIIGIVWGLVPYQLKALDVSALPREFLYNQMNKYFKNESEAFSLSFLAPIYAALLCMINPKVDERWTLEQSNMFFEELFTRYMQHARTSVLVSPLSVTNIPASPVPFLNTTNEAIPGANNICLSFFQSEKQEGREENRYDSPALQSAAAVRSMS